MEAKYEKHERIPTASRVFTDGRIAELVYAPDTKKTTLAVCHGQTLNFTDELEGESGTKLVPVSATNSLIRNNAIVLPEKPEPYGDIAQLVSDIECYMNRYVAVSDGFRRLAAYYILFSWVYDAFEEVPYLRLQADWGSGKTRALMIIGSLCYRAFFASGASTVSPIFHTLDTFRGTLILDEADFRFSDQTAELTKILNNGNVRGFPVFRTAITKSREFDPRAFQVYGPKIVAMRKSFSDEALESRFITERMTDHALRRDIPINLPTIQRAEARALRNKLLQYRFDERLNARINESLVDHALSPRMNQILVPLLSVIPNADTQDEIRRAVVAQEQERRAAQSETTEAMLLELFGDIEAEHPGAPVAVSDLATRFAEQHRGSYDRPITARYVGSILRTRLGLRTYKTNGVYVVATDPKRLASLKARYGVEGKSA